MKERVRRKKMVEDLMVGKLVTYIDRSQPYPYPATGVVELISGLNVVVNGKTIPRGLIYDDCLNIGFLRSMLGSLVTRIDYLVEMKERYKEMLNECNRRSSNADRKT